MNRDLKGIMAKYSLTQEDVASWLKKSRSTISKKIKYGSFDQREQAVILEHLRKYDRDLDMNLFYLPSQLHNV